MRPRRRTTKCPSEPVSFWIALSFSIFVIRYFSIASQWLISFNLYIYIYCIYSKTEDQTLAGKRNSYHFRMKLLFYCIWAVAPRFLKALTMCLLYLPKSKAYFPAEVLPTCTLPCHIPVEEIRWAASYIAVNKKKKNLTLNEGLLTSRFSFVSFMPESSLNAESLLCWCMTRLEKPNKWKCEVNLRAICNLVLQRKLHCLIREVFFSVNNRTPVKQWLLIKWWLK